MERILKLFGGLMLAIVLFSSCEQEDNVIINDLNTDQDSSENIYEYLDTKAGFDSIAKIIRLTDMIDEVTTQDVTFLAPPNEAIISYMYVSSKNSLDDIEVSELEDALKMYIIPEKIDFTLTSKDGKTSYTNLKDDTLLFAFNKTHWNSVSNQGPLATTITYVLDLENDKNNKREVAQSNNILKSNGIVYALSNRHVFSFIDLLED